MTLTLGGFSVQAPSHVDNKLMLDAGYHHLVNWVRSNQTPPAARLIDVRSAIPSLEIQRDANGISRGGIRLSSVDAPTASNTGVKTGAASCRLYGSQEPFSQEKLAALYPTHLACFDLCRCWQAALRQLGGKMCL
jgi:Alpha/beta hydrolase domain